MEGGGTGVQGGGGQSARRGQSSSSPIGQEAVTPGVRLLLLLLLQQLPPLPVVQVTRYCAQQYSYDAEVEEEF